MAAPRRALLSVYDKTGLEAFAQGLHRLHFELIGTEGTAKLLRASGLPAKTVAEVTGVPERLGGRVKTLHPSIFAGILAPRGDEADLAGLGARRIDLVAVNLYPFEAVVAKRYGSHAEAIENIDIGGVSLIRAAAKNAERVTVIVHPERYPAVLHDLESRGEVDPSLRASLALEAFAYTSGYDAAIYNYLARRAGPPLPPALRIALSKATDLRYGENPHQLAALYRDPIPTASVGEAEQLQGKPLSYNNLVDFDAALKLALEFERPTAVIVKHTNPCGVASATSLSEAYAAAHAADPISAYGGIVAVNRTVDLGTAEVMRAHALDGVIAPAFDAAGLELLKAKKKGTFLILRTRGTFARDHGTELVRILGGVLVQTTDAPEPKPEMFRVVTKAEPTPSQIGDILFGIRVSKYVKSNSIVLVDGERTVGIGAGQMSRVVACMLACYKGGPKARGSVAVSDAYFPFRDGIDELAKGGVAAVAQPGGSIRDAEVIAAADEHGLAMVFTGLRLFKH